MRLVDADALIAEYDRVHIGEPGKARKLIEDAPTIEPELTGKWIKGIDVPNRIPYFHLAKAFYCSECRNEAYWDADYGQQLFDYCPNCGARMEEGEQR